MTVLVIIVAALALISAAGVVSAARTIYSALSLVANMVCLAVLFLLLNAQFLAAVQVIVYAGAVMVLFVFIIALLSPTAEDRPVRDLRLGIGLIAIAYVTVQIFAMSVNGVTYDKTKSPPLHAQQVDLNVNNNHLSSALTYDPDSVNQAGNIQTVGGQLFTTFLLPFEITSLLLLVAAIGAVYLTRRHREAT